MPPPRGPARADQSNPRPFAYESVTRKKCDRAKMPGHFCPQCQPFIDAASKGMSAEDIEALKRTCSRHRSYNAPQGTPDDFWNLSFLDSPK